MVNQQTAAGSWPTAHGSARSAPFRLELSQDEGPSTGASVLSLSIHVLALLGVCLFLQFAGSEPQTNFSDATMLHEGRLVAPHRPGDSAHGGGGGGEISPTPASKGEAPPPAAVQKLIAPVLNATVHPEVAASPSIELNAPPIEPNLQFGDPRRLQAVLSAGQGVGGIGSGNGPGVGSESTVGFGRGEGSGSGVLGLGDVSVAPVLVYKVEPEYSDQARQSKYQGSVLIHMEIDEHGIPRNVSVIRSLGLGLDERAVEAVRQWRFRPGMKDGKVVAVEANAEVHFQLF